MTAVVNQMPSPGALPPSMPAPQQDDEWRENLNVRVICPDCQTNPPILEEEFSSGDLVCGECGLVLGHHTIDTRSEWRTFSNDDQGNDDPSRVGDAANPLLNGSQLSTNISYGDGARSRDLVRAQNKQNNDKSTKGLLAAYKQIGSYCDAQQMPSSVAETAKHFYKLVDDAKAFKGKSTEAIIAGCIFIACRQNNVPRTFREIYSLTNVSKKEIGRTFKLLENFFGSKSNPTGTNLLTANGTPVVNFQNTKATEGSDLSLRFCSQLGLSPQNQMITEAMAQKVQKLGILAGRSPLSGVAACIYAASHLMGQPKSAKQVSDVVGVSDGTVKTAYKTLKAEWEKVEEPSWIAKGGDRRKLPAN